MIARACCVLFGLLGLLFLPVISGCSTASPDCCQPIFEEIRARQEASRNALPEARPTGTMTVSLINEIDYGDQFAEQIAEEFVTSPNERLTKLKDEIVKYADRPALNYEIRELVSTTQPNAFSILGGRIYVTMPFLEQMELTDGELAFIIAHEVAHAALRHQPTNMELKYADFYSRATICNAALEGKADPMAVQATFKILDLSTVIMNFEREFEADQYGALYAMQAGYEFSEFISALEKLGSKLGQTSNIGTAQGEVSDRLPGNVPSLPTHPPIEQRVDQLERFRNQILEVIERTEVAIADMEEEKYGEAAAAFENALRIFPESRSLRLNLALANHLKYRETVPEPGPFSGFLTDPLRLEAVWKMAMRGGDGKPRPKNPDVQARDAAREGYRAILTMDGEHILARSNLAVSYLDEQKIDEAIRELKKAVTADNAFETGWKNLTVAYIRKLETMDEEVAPEAFHAIAGEAINAWAQFGLHNEGQVLGVDYDLNEYVLMLENRPTPKP